ncbi:MAG TPA: EAL domain-containing protein [Burkholderiales bacterium]|nr:EAL domain-containing protein [Burkholderiales bacterium]
MDVFSDKDALARIQAATDYPLQRAADGRIVGSFFHCRLGSVFQPVFDLGERQVVGHAAYVRSEADQGGGVSPWGVFALAAEDPVLVRLDRLCRTVHALNYFGAASRRQSLFVGVQPRLLESVKDGHGRAFERILDLIGVETSRVVIEIPAEVNGDWRLLKHVIVNYRSRGYRIAMNHRGDNEGWMAELGSLYPDFVRLDVARLRVASGVRALVDAIHRFGATLLVRDVETEQDLVTAVRAGADLLQGRYLGETVPAVEPLSPRARPQVSHPGGAW